MRIKSNRIAALLAAVLICLSLTGCRKEYTRLDQSAGTTSSTPAATTTTTAAPPQDEGFSVSAPKFRTGRYQMVSTSTIEESLSFLGDKFYTYSSKMSYCYDLAVTAAQDGSLTAVYTYTRATLSETETQNGYTTYSYSADTQDTSAVSEENVSLYALIGKSYSVTVDGGMNITGLSIDESLSELVDRETLTSMALDLFYAMPDTCTEGASWQLSQSGYANTYTLTKMQNNMLVAAITGAETGLPGDYIDPNGQYGIRYTACPPLTGTLWMSTSDRAVQEMSASSSLTGIYTAHTERGDEQYDLVRQSYSTCSITQK